MIGLRHFACGDDGLTGREPWVLHLDTGIQEWLGDLYPSAASSSPYELYPISGGRAVFSASNPLEVAGDSARYPTHGTLTTR